MRSPPREAADQRPALRLDWCSHAAASYAAKHWHYQGRMPQSKLVKIGVWEGEVFVGAVVFGLGATPEIGKPYGLPMTAVCELTRVALRAHAHPVSRILRIAVSLLKKACPGTRLIVSFADAAQGHYGGIYQAAGWVYVGSAEYHAYRVLGRVEHPRTLHDRFGVGGQSIPWLRAHVDPLAERFANGIKHKYCLPLDAAMRAQIAPLAQPYPKRLGPTGVDSDTAPDQGAEAGAHPSVGLHTPSMSV